MPLSPYSPWYNCTSWLGVKHQLTYVLLPYLLTCAHRTTRCGGTCKLRAAEERYPPVTDCASVTLHRARTHAPLIHVCNVHSQSSWREVPTCHCLSVAVTLPLIMHAPHHSWAAEKKYPPHLSLSVPLSPYLLLCTHAPLIHACNMHAESSWREVPTPLVTVWLHLCHLTSYHAHTPIIHVQNMHVEMHPAHSKQLPLSFCSDHIVREHTCTPLRLVSAFVSSFCTHACTHTHHTHKHTSHTHTHINIHHTHTHTHITQTCVCPTHAHSHSHSLFDSLSFCLILDGAKRAVLYFCMCHCLSYCSRIGHSVKPSLCARCVSVCCCCRT